MIFPLTPSVRMEPLTRFRPLNADETTLSLKGRGERGCGYLLSFSAR